MSESSLEYLLSISQKKRRQNVLLLIIGVILVIIAIISLIFDWPFYIIFPSSIIGSGLIGRFSSDPRNIRDAQPYRPKRYPIKSDIIQSIKFRSFQKSRLIASLALIGLSMFFLLIYGAGFGENQIGTWFTLNGFSLWYPLGVIPLAIGIGLIIYVLTSTRTIKLSKTSDLYIIEEKSLIPVVTEIPIREVCAVDLSKSYTGPKFIWIFTLGIQIVLLTIDGAHFLFNPFAFGYGIVSGIAYLFTATYLFIILIYLLFKHQTYLHIVTNEKRYELMFSLPKSKRSLMEQIEMLFKLESVTDYQEISRISNNLRGNKKVNQFVNIIVGGFFIFLAAISLIFRFYTGEIYRTLLILFGMYLIIKGIKEDIIPSGKSIHLLQNQTHISMKKESQNWFYRTLKVDCKPDQLNFYEKAIKLNCFDVGLMIILPGFAGLTLAGFFRFVPFNSSVWLEGIGYTILSILLMSLIAYLFINPVPTLSINTPALKTDIPMRTLNVKCQKIMEKKTVLTRLSAILISFFAGMIISLIV